MDKELLLKSLNENKVGTDSVNPDETLMVIEKEEDILTLRIF